MVNMMSTMFGSVDAPEQWASACRRHGLPFRLHLDGAYGGFYYPFASGESTDQEALSFRNPDVHSITLDAHKMAQAPYGTGIFLARKGQIENVLTPAASYVSGEDCTLIGSRSGANAIAVWMILQTHGPHGWSEKIYILQKRSAWLCAQLDERKVTFFRHPASNIVAMRAEAVPAVVALAHGLVPDNHHSPEWFKIVVMEHVTIERLEAFLADLDGSK
jgi:glutamate/tyrosine decarboxylase-like PLP-dependent enzyme